MKKQLVILGLMLISANAVFAAQGYNGNAGYSGNAGYNGNAGYSGNAGYKGSGTYSAGTSSSQNNAQLTNYFKSMGASQQQIQQSQMQAQQFVNAHPEMLQQFQQMVEMQQNKK